MLIQLSFPLKFTILGIGISFACWWFPFGGKDLHWLPLALLVIYWGILIYQQRFYSLLQEFQIWMLTCCTTKNKIRIFLSLFILQSIALIAYTIARRYSFELHLYDEGFHHDILFNISQGKFYSNVIQQHNFADHLTPTLSFLAIPYFFYPTIHWMMLAKIVAYLLAAGMIPWVAQELIPDKRQAWRISVILLLLWLFLYSPALNTLRRSFQASCFAPPLIFYLYLCYVRQQWVRFALAAMLLLGLKEHLGAVFIGMGCHLILDRKVRLGIFLFISGVLAIYVSMFHLMPYFNDYQLIHNTYARVAPFQDVPEKLLYLLKLLWPLAFLPFLFWKNGIIAAPAIGINLISGFPYMYTAQFQYDDIPSTLLFLAILITVAKRYQKPISMTLLKNRFVQGGLVLWLLGFIVLLPPFSTPKQIVQIWPETEELETLNEVHQFGEKTLGKRVALQETIMTEINRVDNTYIWGREGSATDLQSYDVDFIVLTPKIRPIKDWQALIQKIENSQQFSLYRHNYQHLLIYERIAEF